MRVITVKYRGECRKCGNLLEVNQPAMYEKSMGIFCLDCEPKEIEEIRSFRFAKAERKAEKYEEWAGKRESKANAQLESHSEMRHDWAFITQPGHIPIRTQMIKADDRAFESLNVAKGMRRKAEVLRNVQVAGDAEAKREVKRQTNDAIIFKGSKVYDFCFGAGEVIQVCKKSYRIAFKSKINPDQPYICARDKSYVKPIKEEEVNP
jgi:hypothetical protein